MNRFKELRDALIGQLHQLGREQGWPAELAMDAVSIELPRDPAHGDAATNAAMVLARPLASNPRNLAESIAARLRTLPEVEQVDIAGPGFINLRFAASYWQALLPAINYAKREFGRSDIGQGQKVDVEYVSANPTGPLHIGHARGAVIGDALSRLLAFASFDVTREYYINDAGAQINVLARSAYLRYREACGETIGEIPIGLYPGEYLTVVGQGLKKTYGDTLLDKPEAEWIEPVKAYAIQEMLALIKADLLELGIAHDIFFSEKTLHESDAIRSAIDALQRDGLIYRGILEPPKGKTLDDWEPREQTLFKSTQFGDDVDRALVKSDGSYTYFAADLAYARDKIGRGFDKIALMLGADHGGYVKRMTAAVKALSANRVDCFIQLCQLVKLMEGGQPVKMSKRAGNFVLLRDVLEHLGSDGRNIMRFMMLTRKPEQMLDFDLAKVKEQSKENPVFYVQYAHARCRSVLRNAPDLSRHDVESALTHPAELALIKKLAYWPVVVEQSALASEPHRVAFYVQELAAEFHALWNLGNTNENLRFLVADEKVSAARLVLVEAVSHVLASGLNVLGVEPVEEMR